jgi:hypothetical protein
MRLIKLTPKKIISACVLILLLGGTATFLFIRSRNADPVPRDIKKQTSFTVLETQAKTDWQISPKSVHYNKDVGLLTMTATSDIANLVITEQAQPDVFTDAPQVYPALLNKLNQYQDLHTSIGTVTLTHPKELKGGQTAVANLRQTLIFVRPSRNLTDAQWKDFFNSAQWD